MRTDPVLVHGLLALVLASILLGWGVLLSPPMKGVRDLLGIGDLEGLRFNPEVGAAEIVPLDNAEEFLARIAHYYHALFMILLYGTLTALVHAYRERVRNPEAILTLMLAGTLMTLVGGVVYAYIDHRFMWHGLFIGGLAVCFSAGVLALASFRPGDLLGWATWITGLMLILGGVVGGYVGSSFMDPELREGFVETLIETRFDPDVGDRNEIWRAWTGHQHAMVALSLTLVFLSAIRLLELRRGVFTKLASLGVLLGAPVMALASLSVWGFGKVAHLIITPAALALIAGTLMLSFAARGGPLFSRYGALAWGLRLGNIGVWGFVAVPGAIFAVSLKKPTVFFDPPVRSVEWEWVELAFNIGHWHLLLLAWGVALILVGLYIYPPGRLAPHLMWGSTAGFLGSGLGVALYIFTATPGEYSPNPYSNEWLKLVVEPSLILVTLAVVGLFIGLLAHLLNRSK